VSYVEETILRAGVPQTVLSGGLQARGLAMHWTAGGTGRKGALGTLQFFIDRADRNASYHGLVYWELLAKVLGVIWIVPLSRAAHSMNPAQPPNGPWEPNAEVRRILGDLWWNPNSASVALSFCGMPADLDAAMASPAFVAAFAELVADVIADVPTLDQRPLFNHGWGQPSTRRDAGDRLIPALYAALEDDMPKIIERITGQVALIERVGIPLHRSADSNSGSVYSKTTRATSVQPFAVVEGGAYGIGDGKTSNRYIAYVGTSGGAFFPAYVAEIYTRLKPIAAPSGFTQDELNAAAAKAAADAYENGQTAGAGQVLEAAALAAAKLGAS
jgi:hypothetical protein